MGINAKDESIARQFLDSSLLLSPTISLKFETFETHYCLI